MFAGSDGARTYLSVSLLHPESAFWTCRKSSESRYAIAVLFHQNLLLYGLGHMKLKNARILLGNRFFRCNQQLSHDAVAIFHRWNTFRFMGDNNWRLLYRFLVMIGQENRRNLQSLEIQMPKPQQVLQHPDGTCTSLNDWPFCEVIPFNKQLRSYSTPSVVGLVDNLDSAIEACFRTLGKKRPTLPYMLTLDRHHLPGVLVLTDHHFPDLYNFNLNPPVMIEKFKRDITTNSDGTSQVEVLWMWKCKRHQFADQTKLIQDSRWLIVEREEIYIDQDSTGHHEFFMGFTLRLIESSVASFPADIKTS